MRGDLLRAEPFDVLQFQRACIAPRQLIEHHLDERNHLGTVRDRVRFVPVGPDEFARAIEAQG